MPREARRPAGWAIFSFHPHEIAGRNLPEAGHEAERLEPAGLLHDVARSTIEAGADCGVGQGPRLPPGAGTLAGRPIPYSLGGFVFRNDTVETFPAEAHGRFALGETATPADFLDRRVERARQRRVAAMDDPDIAQWEVSGEKDGLVQRKPGHPAFPDPAPHRVVTDQARKRTLGDQEGHRSRGVRTRHAAGRQRMAARP